LDAGAALCRDNQSENNESRGKPAPTVFNAPELAPAMFTSFAPIRVIRGQAIFVFAGFVP
jgi:hypothetical protein